MSTADLTIGDSAFWRRPLQQRMDDFAALRAQGPFTRSERIGNCARMRSSSSLDRSVGDAAGAEDTVQ